MALYRGVRPLPDTPDSPRTLELDHLSVRLGGRLVLCDLDIRASGRAIGLLGPNGAGKSTLMRTLLGFHRPAAGTARVFGFDVRASHRQLRQRIGYMPEDDAWIGDVSAVGLVRLMGELSGLPAVVALERTHEIFYFLGVGEERYRPVGTYSVGMKQLTKLAAAAVHGPSLLVLDEPTNGLDAAARKRMIAILGQIRDSGHTRLLISSHLLHDVEACCDEVLILRDGRLVEHSDLDRRRRTNRKFLNLELLGGGEGFVENARAAGCEVSNGDASTLRLVLPEGMEVLEIYHLASLAGATIGRLSYKRDSLEDIFLEAMQPDGHP